MTTSEQFHALKDDHDSFTRIYQELIALHVEKRASYGTLDDPLANYRYASAMGFKAYDATLLRMNEKFIRLQNLFKAGRLEDVREELKDIAVITIITIGLLDEVINE